MEVLVVRLLVKRASAASENRPFFVAIMARRSLVAESAIILVVWPNCAVVWAMLDCKSNSAAEIALLIAVSEAPALCAGEGIEKENSAEVLLAVN
jgi:hypothetical protein